MRNHKDVDSLYEFLEYEIDGLNLRFYGLVEGIHSMKPILDEVTLVLRIARGPHIENGTYDILFVESISSEEKPRLSLAGCTYIPHNKFSDLWARSRRRWPSLLLKMIPGPYIAISALGMTQVLKRFNYKAMVVDLADTLHHELLHLCSGVRHGSDNDICLEDAEKFIHKALEFYPLDEKSKEIFTWVAAKRRQLKHG